MIRTGERANREVFEVVIPYRRLNEILTMQGYNVPVRTLNIDQQTIKTARERRVLLLATVGVVAVLTVQAVSGREPVAPLPKSPVPRLPQMVRAGRLL
jgi:hypothetical protein